MGERLVEPVLLGLTSQGVAVAECQDVPVFVGQYVDQVVVDPEVCVEINHVGLVGPGP
jgi:hypothetical protein